MSLTPVKDVAPDTTWPSPDNSHSLTWSSLSTPHRPTWDLQHDSRAATTNNSVAQRSLTPSVYPTLSPPSNTSTDRHSLIDSVASQFHTLGITDTLPLPPPPPSPSAPLPIPNPNLARLPFNPYHSSHPTNAFGNPIYNNLSLNRPPIIDYPYTRDTYHIPQLAESINSLNNAPQFAPFTAQSLPSHPMMELPSIPPTIYYDAWSNSVPNPSQFYLPPNPSHLLYSPATHHNPPFNRISSNYNVPANHFARSPDPSRSVSMGFPHNTSRVGHSPLMEFNSPRRTPASANANAQSPFDFTTPYHGLLASNAVNPSQSRNPPRHAQQHASSRNGRFDGKHPVIPATRSPLLEEFRSSKSRSWELNDVVGHMAEFSRDQHGSRFLQEKLERASVDEKNLLFKEIIPRHAIPLMQDVFGNYVVQKLFEFGTPHHKTMLVAVMEGNLLSLSLQVYACRVVQKALDRITAEQQTAFVRELEQHILRCVKDANGNHVIQKMIEVVVAQQPTFVRTFRGHVFELATHPYGCRVLQRCFEHMLPEHARILLEEMHQFIHGLIQDQFGNYVIQYVLEKGSPEDRNRIILRLRGQVLIMSRHKFASNVCEKALLMADEELRHMLIEELMTPSHDGTNPIAIMMKDQFANYVLQRALTLSVGSQHDALFNKVRAQLVNLRRHSSAYSKHLTSIERILDKRAAPTNGSR